MENRYPREVFWAAALVLVISPLFRFSWDLAPQTFFHVSIAGTLCFFLARNQCRPAAFPEIPLALFFSAAALSWFSAADRSIARNELFVLFDALAFLALFSFLPNNEKKRLLLIPPFIGLALSVILFIFFVFPAADGTLARYVPADAFVNANTVAGFLFFAFILSLIPLLERPRSKGAVLLAFILFMGLAATRSRAAIAAGCASALFFAWPYLSSRLRRIAIMTAVVIVMLIVVITVYKQTDSFSTRLTWWQAAVRMGIDNPLTGVGWGNFGVSYLSYRTQPVLNTLYAHNVYLQIFAESGLAGLLTFTLVIFSFARAGFAKAERSPVVRGAAAAAAGFLALSFLDFSFYLPAHLFVLGACAGTLYERHAKPRSSPLALVLYVFIFLLYAMAVIRPFIASRWYAQGLYLHKGGMLDSAATAYEKAARLDPLSPSPLSKNAELSFSLYLKERDPALLARAISLQKNAVGASRVTSSLWSDLAWLYQAAGKNEEALHAMRQAVRHDIHNPAYQNSLLRLSSAPGSASSPKAPRGHSPYDEK